MDGVIGSCAASKEERVEREDRGTEKGEDTNKNRV